MTDIALFNTEEILALLQLEQTGSDRFRGRSHFMGSPNVFGGQVLGQALHAAGQTVSEGRRPHSLHSLFILTGKLSLPVDYEVERVRDGGSFSTRRVVASQEGKRIFVLSASYQQEEEGLSHQRPMPAAPDPETLPSNLELWFERAKAAGQPYIPAPVDFRSADGSDPITNPTRSPRKQVWIRAPHVLPDARNVHEELFAYVSDYGLLSTSLQPHGVSLRDPRLQIASLDHTVWFHRPFRMDEWLLFDIESTNAAGGRGLNFSTVYNQKGELVATCAQEGLIRLRQPKGDAAA